MYLEEISVKNKSELERVFVRGEFAASGASFAVGPSLTSRLLLRCKVRLLVPSLGLPLLHPSCFSEPVQPLLYIRASKA